MDVMERYYLNMKFIFLLICRIPTDKVEDEIINVFALLYGDWDKISHYDEAKFVDECLVPAMINEYERYVDNGGELSDIDSERIIKLLNDNK